jgi:hypothetical protein
MHSVAFCRYQQLYKGYELTCLVDKKDRNLFFFMRFLSSKLYKFHLFILNPGLLQVMINILPMAAT